MSRITGRGWAFPPHLDDRDRIAMVEDDTDIRQSMFIILNTVPGERVMRPDFGCQIHELVFSPANEYTATQAERYVREALTRWEARIELQEVTVTPGNTEYGELRIDIRYRVKNHVEENNLVYPFYLTPS